MNGEQGIAHYLQEHLLRMSRASTPLSTKLGDKVRVRGMTDVSGR